MARFQPIKTFTKLLKNFCNLLSVIIGWKTGHIQAIYGPQATVCTSGTGDPQTTKKKNSVNEQNFYNIREEF